MMGGDSPRLRIALRVLAGLLAAYTFGVITWQSVTLAWTQRMAPVAGGDITLLPALALACACIGFVHAILAAAASTVKNYCACLVLAVSCGILLLLAILATSAAAAAEELGHFTDVALELEASRAVYATEPAQWDALQRERYCCGVQNASDWSSVVSASRGVPMSCCAPVDGQVGMSVCFLTSNNRHRFGCAPGLRDDLRGQFEIACYTSIVQFVLQVASLGVVSTVTHRLRNEW